MMIKRFFLFIFLILFFFTSVANCDYINNYAPETPWILNPDGERVSKVDPDGAIRVRNQDQTTPPVILALSRYIANTTLLAPTVKDTFTIQVSDTTGFTDGRLIFIADENLNEIMFCGQVGPPVGNTITIDRPVDFSFFAGDPVEVKDINMNVVGSPASPMIFGLKPKTITGDLVVDVTRIMWGMTTNDSVDLSTFGDISGGLTYGVTLRRVDGVQTNILNVKDNGTLATFSYDTTFYSASNPQQGQNGLVSRLTFAGPSKMGVVVRIGSDSDLELVIVDDLSSLLRFSIVAEGSLVVP